MDKVDLVRLIGEMMVIMIGIGVTYMKRNKVTTLTKQLADEEEHKKRQRIEIVIQEEKIEDLEDDIKDLEAEIVRLRGRLAKKDERKNTRKEAISQILPELSDKEISRLI